MTGEQDEDEGAVFGVQRRKAVIGLVVAAVLAVGAVAAIGQATSFGALSKALGSANWAWIPVAMVGEAAAWAGYVVAYRSVAAADGGPLLRYRDVARVVTIGLGAYVIASDVGGLTVDYWAMRAAGAKLHDAARRTLALNTLQAAALACFALLGGIAYLVLGRSGTTGLVMAAVWTGVVPAAFAGAAVASSGRVAPVLMEPVEDVQRPPLRKIGRLRHWLWTKLRKGFADAIGGVVVVRHVVSHPRRYLGGLLGYPLFWLGDFFILWATLHAFGTDLDPARLVVAESTAWALSFVPLPGGGSGFAEVTIAYTLHAVGVPLEHAIFAALVYRAINFWLPIVPALALLPQIAGLRESLSEADRAEPDEDVDVHAV